MAPALSTAVSGTVSATGLDAADHLVHLSLDEMEAVLRHWESLDDVKWDEDTRMACSAWIEEHDTQSVADFKAQLIRVPADVESRYRQVMKLLLDRHLIDEVAFDAEIAAMNQFSPATLARRGKDFADWYRANP